MDKSELSEQFATLTASILAQEGIEETQKPPGTIYHYTGAAGLRGIIENDCIWATHASYLNDTSEGRYGETMAGELLQERFQPLTNHWVKTDDGTTKAPPEIASKYAFLFDAFMAITRFLKNDVYVSSFCLKDNLLSQWRAYGKQGGYSIGLDIASGVCRIDEEKEFGTFKIIYDPATQRRIMDKFISGVVESFENHQEQILADDWHNRKSVIYNGHQEALVAGLLSIGLRFKDPSFADEQEWRFYATKAPYDVDDVQLRDQEGLLVPYVELPFVKDWITIKSIRCGPTLHPQLAQRSVRMLTTKAGLKGLHVISSEIPLRT